MSLIKRLGCALVTVYLSSILAAATWSSSLRNNLSYTQKRDNGQVVKIENRHKSRKDNPALWDLFPKVTIREDKYSVVGIDTNDDGTIDNITFYGRKFKGNSLPLESLISLNSLANSQSLQKVYDEIMSGDEYRETIQKRQKLSNNLFKYSLFFGVSGLFISGILKYELATPEQLKHSLFHCR